MFPSLPFPQEVVAIIMDYLHIDRATLLNCARANKQLAYEAQSHLFRTIDIGDKATLDKFVNVLKIYPGQRPRGDLINHVRIIKLRAGTPSSYSGLGSIASEAWPWLLEVTNLSGVLRNVQGLHFEGFDWRVHPVNATLLSAFRKFKGVSELGLLKCKFTTFKDCEAFFAACKGLTRLSIDVPTWEAIRRKGEDIDEPQACVEVVQFDKRAHRLTFLRIGRTCPVYPVKSWLATTSSLRYLRDLCLDELDPSDIADAGHMLSQLGRNLVRLKLGCRYDSDYWSQWKITDHIQLSRNTNLRSLHLGLIDTQDLLMIWVPLVLGQTRALESLTFDIRLWMQSQLNGENWNKLEEVLLGDRFPRVTFVQKGNVDQQGPLDLEGTKAVLRARFPRLSAFNKPQRLYIVEEQKHASKPRPRYQFAY
ncbi:hypothetical protein EW026_g3881 [Hermanssonia centrifuga]|uniref:F-box domain-containing protein n=1 Tax=Hermanssonia centrifuga TaxID=98765 RepID=A0A4S4KK27_9APHY|nr:hypothetical protein EW026_g3881 [Hermanssonia centrifuga]